MLQLNGIKKDYITGNETVHALKGIDLAFRKSEFVAILGHSGCGKTTMLNIIGGLDHYTSGDLIINGRSTRRFSDGDWDSYRNHSIGFVFQSYNLIPHQTVLANVELALTLSGVGKSERRQRAIEALERVGLGDQLNKKPNQMSGGQMQRVAIARALVNNPDILLADEPTGALDSETSVQIMEILREISKDKLIIMVTHNPELAETYASRIIRLRDGLIISDSAPYDGISEEGKKERKKRRPTMSAGTALSLSLNNLLTKKTRTILTAVAGSIGIIGIALITSLSNGIQNYIDKVQEDTLSSYPITLESETVDLGNMVTSLMGVQAEVEENRHEKDAVYSSTVMYDLMNTMLSTETQKNNLRAFKEYLESKDSPIRDYMSAVQYSYDLDMNIFAQDVDGNIVKTDVMKLLEDSMSSIYGGDYSSLFSTYSQYYTMLDVWQEMLPDSEGKGVNPLLMEQYDMLYGTWPQNYDEVVLVVDKNNEISDLVLYALGLKSNSEISSSMESYISLETVDAVEESWSYEEICGMSFSYVFPADEYVFSPELGTYMDLTAEDIGLRTLYDNGMKIRIVGIIRQNSDAVSGMMTGAIGYTHALVEEVIKQSAEKEIVKAQLKTPGTDVFSGLPYMPTDTNSQETLKVRAAKRYLRTASESEKADVYVKLMSYPSDETVNEILDEQMADTTREDIEETVKQMYPGYASMLAQMDDETLMSYVRQMMAEQVREQYAAMAAEEMYKMGTAMLASQLDSAIILTDDYVWIYDNAMPKVYSDATLEDNLKKLGYVDLDDPHSISIFAATFEDKDAIADAIEKYNERADEKDVIDYTDVVALLMSSVTSIINVISYVLIAFVAISLVVSSIMIGIITYISVLERTKEIGILRAIGASKRDISRVFNAETVIEGFASGVFGIAMTLILNIPINIIVHHLTGINALNSVLPTEAGILLIIISVVLTYIAGLIPSGIAAKKDPVEALRTE